MATTVGISIDEIVRVSCREDAGIEDPGLAGIEEENTKAPVSNEGLLVSFAPFSSLFNVAAMAENYDAWCIVQNQNVDVKGQVPIL